MEKCNRQEGRLIRASTSRRYITSVGRQVLHWLGNERKVPHCIRVRSHRKNHTVRCTLGRALATTDYAQVLHLRLGTSLEERNLHSGKEKNHWSEHWGTKKGMKK